MFKPKLLNLFCIITGLVFLASGFSKMLDVTGFAYLVSSYGLRWAGVFAPAIVVVEIVVGLLLVFGIQLRRVSLFSVFMLAAFTIAYGYGYWAHQIEDCGCFGGVMSRVKTPFWVVFIRNAFLIYFMVAAYRLTVFERLAIKWKPALIHFTIIVAAFASGLTYHPISRPRADVAHETMGRAAFKIPEPFEELLSPDSSYFVFVFSYTCPYCWNSIENLKQYANLPEIDRVIGITPADTTHSALFYKQFNPQFSIYALPPEVAESMASAYPTAFYVRNDSIRRVIKGGLPCSYFFQKSIKTFEESNF